MYKYPELTKDEVNTFIEKKVEYLIKAISRRMDKGLVIFVPRNIMKENKALFIHTIRISTLEKLAEAEYWDDSEIFNKTDDHLFLYLKGRLLIQQTTNWIIYSDAPMARHYELNCNYSIKAHYEQN